MNHGAGSPRAATASTSAREGSRWMSTKATRARWAHKCSTIEAPIPLPPPVTKTTRSARLGYEANCAMSALLISTAQAVRPR